MYLIYTQSVTLKCNETLICYGHTNLELLKISNSARATGDVGFTTSSEQDVFGNRVSKTIALRWSVMLYILK